MNVDFNLTLDRDELVMGESTTMSLSLTNHANRALKLTDPRRSTEWPKLLVRDLERGTEAVFAPQDLANRRHHEFQIPRPPAFITLEPGGSYAWQDDLLRWAELPHPGRYELVATMRTPLGETVTPPIVVTTKALNLLSARFASQSSGYHPYRFCLFSHDAGDGSSVLVLSGVNASHHGEPQPGRSRRIAEVPGLARPILAVCPAGESYPVHWIAWLSNTQLSRLYLMQQRVLLPPITGDLPAPATDLIEPILLDLAGVTPAHPARGRLGLWIPGEAGNTLALVTLEPDGSLSPGPRAPVDAGRLAWASAAAVHGGEGRVVLAMERGLDVEIEALLRWKGDLGPARAVPIARVQGRFLAAGMTLSNDDVIHGALVAETNGYAIHPFRVERDGSVASGLPIPLDGGGIHGFDRAVVEVSPDGLALALLRAPDGRWSYASPAGRCSPLPADLRAFGEPIAAYFRSVQEPLVILASAETGITYHPLPPLR